MSPVDLIRNVDKICNKIFNITYNYGTQIYVKLPMVPNLREIKHSVELWPKLNYSNRKEEVKMNRLKIGRIPTGKD